jgi:hypothetical protein
MFSHQNEINADILVIWTIVLVMIKSVTIPVIGTADV